MIDLVHSYLVAQNDLNSAMERFFRHFRNAIFLLDAPLSIIRPCSALALAAIIVAYPKVCDIFVCNKVMAVFALPAIFPVSCFAAKIY